MIEKFPPVDLADPESGLLALGGDLEVASLELAYRSGIFPWPVRGQPLLWFAPLRRAILDFCDLKIPRRLQRYLKQRDYSFRIDNDFESVIKACAQSPNRAQQQGTWITEEMQQAYTALHTAGLAHSFETYDQNEQLVGGLYGVSINGYFAGESMFFVETNASKFALIEAINYLEQKGIDWMDIQMLTPLLSSFGAKEIDRDTFMSRLNLALQE